ncbi:MAG: hypothetical protein AAFX94_08865 [Myxococcota bacterium]
MMKRFGWTALTLLLACGSEELVDPVGSGDLAVSAALELQNCADGGADAFAAGHPAPVKLTFATINEDTLTLGVQFSGGCNSHDFALCWNGAFTRSMPPQTSVWLLHETEDTCEAALTETLTFSLASLESSYRGDRSTDDGNEVVLRVADQRVSYFTDETNSAVLQEACGTGGCSGELCAPASVAADLSSTCEARPEYACLEDATCERQSDGRCGWTYSEKALQCLNGI